MLAIDLNADLGEGVGDDDALLGVVTSANIATGAHAGGGEVLRRAVAQAVDRGVAVGAHPSYADRLGFGRASLLPALRDDPDRGWELSRDLARQVVVVAEEVARRGARLRHVKAHGALYNDAVADPIAADIVIDAVNLAGAELGLDLAVVTQPGGHLAQRAPRRGLTVWAEGFVDRGYAPDGTLVSRSTPGALLETVAGMVDQAVQLAGGYVTSTGGLRLDLHVNTLCVHGDTPNAVTAARAVRLGLERAGWSVTTVGS